MNPPPPVTSNGPSQDFFDENPDLLDEVIFGVCHPDLANPGVEDIIQDRELISLLLVRHFKFHGGLCLPSLQPARQITETHEGQVRAELAAGCPPSNVRYPTW